MAANFLTLFLSHKEATRDLPLGPLSGTHLMKDTSHPKVFAACPGGTFAVLDKKS